MAALIPVPVGADGDLEGFLDLDGLFFFPPFFLPFLFISSLPIEGSTNMAMIRREAKSSRRILRDGILAGRRQLDERFRT